MSELVLYRKYRPRHFDEVVGQEHVVGAIRNAFKLGRVAHAYLFSGPRGVGKTTLARLIAKSLNCKENGGSGAVPCNACTSCTDFNEGRAVDMIEIDAASNTGVDDVRELREGVRFVPMQGSYKTYIIDEAHQLSKPAFNALLKTLEEPPPHVVFVLATTELEKVPATVVSRTQHYTFRRPTPADISGRLIAVAKKEKVTLDEDAARLIAFAAEGGVRDAESIFGQIMAIEDRKITRAEVEEILGLPKREAVKEMFGLVAKRDLSSAFGLIQKVTDSGCDLAHFSKLLMRYFRSALFLKIDPSLKQYIEIDLLPDEYECITANLSAFTREELVRGADAIFNYSQRFKHTPIPQLPLELMAVELIDSNSKPA